MRLIYLAVFNLFLSATSFALPVWAEESDKPIVAMLPPDPGITVTVY